MRLKDSPILIHLPPKIFPSWMTAWSLPSQVFAAILATCAWSHAQGPFTEVANPGDLSVDFYYNFGSSWADYDEDGDVDLFVVSGLQQRNYLYRNNGNLTFTRMTSAESGDLGNDSGDSSIGVWADMDNDGDLDVYVANFSMAQTFSDYYLATTLPQPDRVYVNDGTGTFTLRTDPVPGVPHQYAQSISMIDLDKDGFLNAILTTFPLPLNGPPTPDILFRNTGSLVESSEYEVLEESHGGPAIWADFDGDGDQDVLVPSEFSTSWMYVNQLVESGSASMVPISQFSNGVVLRNAVDAFCGDYDNDGDWDFVLNQPGTALYSNQGDGTFSMRLLRVPPAQGARHGAWLDFDNDGDLDLLLETREQGQFSDVVIYENRGGGVFVEEQVLLTPANNSSTRLSVADMNNDGFMDIFTGSYTAGATGTATQERDRIWMNTANTNHWLKLVLKGTESNRGAIGTIIRVQAAVSGGATVTQMRQVESSSSIFSQHDPRPNFGLGVATMADEVRIEWPSGKVQVLHNIAANQILEVIEPPSLQWAAGNTLSWPAGAIGFRLESAIDLGGPWGEVSAEPTLIAGRQYLVHDTSSGAAFYRLRHP